MKNILLVLCGMNFVIKDYDLSEIGLATEQPNSLIMFYADWCPHCKKFNPIFEEYVKKINTEKILIGKVNLNDDDNPLWDKFNIIAVPTLIAFSNNSIKHRRDAKMGVGLTYDDMISILSEIIKDV